MRLRRSNCRFGSRVSWLDNKPRRGPAGYGRFVGSQHGDEPGPLIGKGRAADVFDIGGGRVLRRNRNGASTEKEAEVMRHLHRHGYPVPEVFDTNGGDLVMERIDGPTMLEAFTRTPWRMLAWANMLASLHHRLEAVPPDIDLPVRFGDPEVIVHADLHPDNVMLTAAGPVVIDWPNAGLGNRGADVANTWIIVATSEADSDRVRRFLQSAGRSLFLRSFLRAAGRDPARHLLPMMAANRLEDRNLLPGEARNIHRLLDRQGLGTAS
jgi:aminoglycoside phosphotransferase (APT) family kinase protein